MTNRSRLPAFPPGMLRSREWATPHPIKEFSVPGQIVPGRTPGRRKASVHAGFPVPGNFLSIERGVHWECPLIDRDNNATPPGALGGTSMEIYP
jgi:hypothetical protein